jgi:hypothetical protein
MSLTFTLLAFALGAASTLAVPQNPERGERREDHRRKRGRQFEIYRNGCQNAVKNEARPGISAATAFSPRFDGVLTSLGSY